MSVKPSQASVTGEGKLAHVHGAFGVHDAVLDHPIDIQANRSDLHQLGC